MLQRLWPSSSSHSVSPKYCHNVELSSLKPLYRGKQMRLTRVSPKTQCQDEFRSLSGSVPEILTACRMLQILIAWCQIEAEIRGFPTMYIIGGVNMVKIGEKRDFIQILGL